MEHDDTATTWTLWKDDYMTKYFDLLSKYEDNIIIEVAGHDHWQDLRVNRDENGNHRNLLIASSISLRYRNLPGFNTFRIDTDRLVAYNLVETTLDVTATYGHDELVPLKDIPSYEIDYEQ